VNNENLPEALEPGVELRNEFCHSGFLFSRIKTSGLGIVSNPLLYGIMKDLF
jgi:hypothetical protein